MPKVLIFSDSRNIFILTNTAAAPGNGVLQLQGIPMIFLRGDTVNGKYGYLALIGIGQNCISKGIQAFKFSFFNVIALIIWLGIVSFAL